MSKKLVVVESPAKARTIGRFLGSTVDVLASMGHVRDLPQHELGVHIHDDFRPEYELTLNGKKVVKGLRAAAAQADEVYLATDPDREGEAIAWHLKAILQNAAKGPFHRITFHEITQNAIRNSLSQPGEIAEDLVNAQQARRVLDRLVGYQVSPMLWKYIGKGTSAGRVQSVALRLIVEREREIQAFNPEEYWNLDAMFLTPEPKTRLKTRLFRLNGEKAVVPDAGTADLLENALQSAGVIHEVAKVTSNPRKQYAPPPFITSTLQQAAGSYLKFGTSQTMRVAQELYEGVEIGNGGASGLITYMRTDSVSIAKEAQEDAAQFIRKAFGEDYLPAKPNVYRSRKSAQEAHEAIRPTDVNRTPESLSSYLSGPQLKLYRLIWNRFLASQMTAARQLDHVIEIESSGGSLSTLQLPGTAEKAANSGTVCTFRAAARETKFQGYLAVYSMKDIGEEDEMDNLGGVLPPLKPGSLCELLELLKEQCFTSPPSRYSEASLVKALEQNGVGRPSTFAATVNTILERDYVSKEKSSLMPTKLGFDVNDFLVQQMPDLFNVGFTAEMEDQLDQIEEGHMDWVVMLKKFYEQLQSWMGSGEIQPGAAISGKELEPLLSRLFPQDFKFAKPAGKGRKVYDDEKFISSIRKQLASKKALTERQWKALLNTFGKYAADNPEFLSALKEAGLEERVRNAIAASENKPEKKTQELPPDLLKLLKAMENLEWEKPVKRGKRVYDDGKFFRSLQRQAQSDGRLTEAQIVVLSKLAAKYAGKIAGYAELSSALGWQEANGVAAASGGNAAPVAAAPASPEEVEKIQTLLKMTCQIKTWREPSGKGRRVYNDREFVTSLENQFQQKGSLSDRQVAALVKLLGKYSEQIPGFKEKTGEMAGCSLQPKQLDEKCPNCGAPLVQRMGHGRPFIGCSAFPKCRYIAPKKKQE